MNKLRNFSAAVRSLPAKFCLRALAMTAVLIGTGSVWAGETEVGEGDPMWDILETLNNVTPGMKAIAAAIGFIVALISLIALRSFAAVLFFFGLAVFAAAGLSVATAVIGAPIGLI